VITCGRDEAQAIVQAENGFSSGGKAPLFEVVALDDAPERRSVSRLTDAGGLLLVPRPKRGLARAWNEAANAATGRVLVFLQPGVRPPPNWLRQLGVVFAEHPTLAAASPAVKRGDNGVTSYGCTWDDHARSRPITSQELPLSPVPFFSKGCMAIRRRVFREVGGFDAGFYGSAREDEELAVRLWLWGYEVGCCRDIAVVSDGSLRPPWPTPAGAEGYNLLRLAASHFAEARLAGLICRMEESIDPTYLLSRVITDDTPANRGRSLRRRVHTDDWFMSRFHISL
jgi:GT2 family glycosyltransferase